MLLRSFTALACITFFWSNAMAQRDFRPGYVVVAGDTLNGFLLYGGRNTANAAVFKSRKHDKAKTYTAGDASAYGFRGDKQYVAVEIGTPETPRKVFAYLLQKGEIDLYYSAGKFLLFKDNQLTVLERKPDSIAMKKKYGEIQPAFVHDVRFVQKLNMLIASDCGLNANSIQFSRRSISALIGKYNKCRKNHEELNNMKPIARVGASFSIGMFASTLTVNESPDYILKANIAPVWQFEIEVKMPRLSDRFTIAVGFQPVKSTYRGTTSVTSSTQTRVDDMTLKPHYVKIPASLKYNFGNPENSFFVRAGGWIGILNREKSTFTSRRSFISGSDVQISDNDMSYFYRFRSPGGAWMGVGYDRSIARRVRIFGEFRYETNGGFIGTDAVPESSFNFISLMVGIGF